MSLDDTKFVRGASKLGQRIATVRASLGLPALVEEIGSLLLKRTLQSFDKEEDPDGKPWPALKGDTEVAKKRLGYSTGKLKRTLTLRDSIKLIRGGAGTFAVNTGAGVRIGIENPDIAVYARVQNSGSPSQNIPARRFMGIGRLDIKAVDSLMRRKAVQIEKSS